MAFVDLVSAKVILTVAFRRNWCCEAATGKDMLGSCGRLRKLEAAKGKVKEITHHEPVIQKIVLKNLWRSTWVAAFGSGCESGVLGLSPTSGSPQGPYFSL